MGDVVDIGLQILMCILGTIAFAVTMNAPRRTLIYIAAGALISASIERILSLYTDDFLSCLTAMITLTLYCEIIARIIKEPTTITLIPSTIPLLPGSSIYNTMLYAINAEHQLMMKYASSTLLAGLGIALGAVISTTAVKIFFTIKKHN